MSLSIVLFGSGGFIGRHVRRALLADPRVGTVSCVDRDRHDLVRDRLADLVALLHDARPHAVVSCAGRLSGSGHELVAAHAVTTAKLIDAIAQAAPGARLVRIGSAAEYGRVTPGLGVTEDAPAAPVSPYGLSHLAATELVELASAGGRIDGVVLRVFNPIGPGLSGENVLGRAAALLRGACERGEEYVRLGPLGAYRDFVDVRDVAAAVLAAVVLPRPAPARLFNVASGTAVTVRQAVVLLAAAAGFAGEIQEMATAAVPSRSTAVSWMRGDIRRARHVLGWAPAHDLPDSVKAVLTGDDG